MRTFQLHNREERLKRYYNHFDIESRYGFSFNEFVNMVDSGRWQDFMLTDNIDDRSDNFYYVTTDGLQ